MLDLDEIFGRAPGDGYYRLMAMINHDGARSLDAGHYIACVWGTQLASWQKCMDNIVFPTSASHALWLAKQAYMLHYQRCER